MLDFKRFTILLKSKRFEEADRLLQDNDTTWDQVLVEPRILPRPTPLASRSRSQQDALDLCNKHSDKLTAWESDFLASMRKSINRFGSLTEKQALVVFKMRDRILENKGETR